MRTALTMSQAKTEVEALIKRTLTNAGGHADEKVELILWYYGDLSKAPPCIGVRITEISITRADASGVWGCSIMACEPGSLGTIAAAERAMIERMVCSCGDSDEWENEIEDADWRLAQLLVEPAHS